MGNRANKAKTMALLDLEYSNEMEKINNDLELAIKAREDDALTKDIVQFGGKVASIVLGVPIIDPIVDTITEVYDYVDKSEHVYLDSSDYKFGKDKINNINRDLKDYDATQIKSDILAYGTDQLQWYKETGGYDYKEDEWRSLGDYLKHDEWKEYGSSPLRASDEAIDAAGKLFDKDNNPDNKKINDSILEDIAKETGVEDLNFEAEVQAKFLEGQFDVGDYGDSPPLEIEKQFMDADELAYFDSKKYVEDYYKMSREDFEELPDFQREYFKTLAVEEYSGKGRFEDLASQFGLTGNQVTQVTEDFREWLKDNEYEFIRETSYESSFELLKLFMKEEFNINPAESDYNQMLHDEFQIRYGD